MNYIFKFIHKINFKTIYLTTFLLLNIPHYYILPFPYFFLNTYFLAGILTGILFLYSLVLFFRQSSLKQFFSNKLSFLVIFVLLGQTLSIISTTHISAFLQSYSRILFGVIFFFITIVYVKKSNESWFRYISTIFLIATIINVVNELFIFFNFNLYFKFATLFLDPTQLNFIAINQTRGRLYLDTYIEIAVPILLLIVLTNTKKWSLLKITSLLLIILIGFLALVSGWRTRLIVFIISFFVGSIITLHPFDKFKKTIFIVISFFLISVLFIANNQMVQNYGFSSFTRLLLQNEEALNSITTRLSFYQRATDIFISSPIFGVGLGNYQYFSPTNNNASLSKEAKLQNDLLNLNPHNIFFELLAESGLLGVIPFSLLIYIFVKDDFEYFVSNKSPYKYNKIIKLMILSFWMMFLFPMTGSEMSYRAYGLFFGLRGAIELARSYFIPD